jgi:hypothetical protein
MGVIDPVIDILPEVSQPPVGYTKIPCHIIFDKKMDFTRKARFVPEGHVTDPSSTISYASVLYLLAAINDLDILSADIQGACLNAPCCEKV